MAETVTTQAGDQIAGKWWERLLNTEAAAELVDGLTNPKSTTAVRTEATAPEPTIQDREPYLNRILTNESSQKVLLTTLLIVGAIGALAYYRSK